MTGRATFGTPSRESVLVFSPDTKTVSAVWVSAPTAWPSAQAVGTALYEYVIIVCVRHQISHIHLGLGLIRLSAWLYPHLALLHLHSFLESIRVCALWYHFGSVLFL